MTPEKFRQWIVILFAVSIVTIWVGMGMKVYKINRYSATPKYSMMKRAPRGTIPSHRKVMKKRTPAPAKATKPAK